MQGQPDREYGSFAYFALDLNRTTMPLDNAKAHGQSESGPLSGSFCRKEGIENTALVFDRNTRPAVLKNDLHRIVMDDTAQHDRFLRTRFDRIARIRQQIEKHLFQLNAIAEHTGVGRRP